MAAASWAGKKTVIRWNDNGQTVGLTDTLLVRANINRVRLMIVNSASTTMAIWAQASAASPTFYRLPLVRYGAYLELNRDEDPGMVGLEWHGQMITLTAGVYMSMEEIIVG